MADREIDDIAFPPWENICVLPADIPVRRDSITTLVTLDGSETVSYYAGPPTPTGSAYCNSFHDFNSSSRMCPSGLPATYVGYDELPTDYEGALSPWLSPMIMQPILEHTPGLKPSPMPDISKLNYSQTDTEIFHTITTESNDIIKREILNEEIVHEFKSDPCFEEHMNEWGYPNTAFNGQGSDYVSFHSHWSDTAKFCLPQLPPSPTTTAGSSQSSSFDGDRSTGSLVKADTSLESPSSSAASPYRFNRRDSLRRSSKLGRVLRPGKHSSMNRVSKGPSGEGTSKTRHPCNKICTKPPKDAKDGFELRADGRWYCIKTFQRMEHLTRHKKCDRHTFPDPSDSSQYFCALEGCTKSRKPKDNKEVTGFGNRKDNLEDHIMNTHCQPSSNNKRNTRITREEAIELGWETYFVKGLHKYHVKAVKQKWNNALKGDETQAIQEVVDYFREHDQHWTGSTIRKEFKNDRLQETLHREGFELEASTCEPMTTNRACINKRKDGAASGRRGCVA